MTGLAHRLGGWVRRRSSRGSRPRISTSSRAPRPCRKRRRAAALSREAARADRKALTCEIFRRRRALMAEELALIPGSDVTMPDGRVLLLRGRPGVRQLASDRRALLPSRRVIVIPGEAFGPAGRASCAISYAAGDDDIRAGVRALGDVLAS